MSELKLQYVENVKGDWRVVRCASCGCIASFLPMVSAAPDKCPACTGDVWWDLDYNIGPIFYNAPVTTIAVLHEVLEARGRQDEKWGPQDHPDGTSEGLYSWDASVAKRSCQRKAAAGTVTWVDILDEGIFEAYEQEEWKFIREELVQAAAVIVNWIESGDRRG